MAHFRVAGDETTGRAQSYEGNIEKLPVIQELDTLVAWEYFLLLLDNMMGPYIPLRFVMFIIAGSFGAMFHVSILWLLWGKISTSFLMAQFTATTIAMTINFISNNYFTYSSELRQYWPSHYCFWITADGHGIDSYGIVYNGTSPKVGELI